MTYSMTAARIMSGGEERGFLFLFSSSSTKTTNETTTTSCIKAVGGPNAALIDIAGLRREFGRRIAAYYAAQKLFKAMETNVCGLIGFDI